MPSLMMGPLRTRRPIRIRSLYGPGPVWNGFGAPSPVKYCQSDTRQRSWISRAPASMYAVTLLMLVAQVKVVNELQLAACAHGVMQSSKSVGSGVSVFSTLVCERKDQLCRIL